MACSQALSATCCTLKPRALSVSMPFRTAHGVSKGHQPAGSTWGEQRA